MSPLLHHFAATHDDDAIGKMLDDAEIVGDEHDRHAETLLQRAQQIEDLRLDRHVERGRRLIGDEQIRFIGECHGDHDTLALAAGHFMRIGIDAALGFGNADELEQFQHAHLGLFEGHALVMDERFGDLPADRIERIKRGHRLLEDHGDLRRRALH